MKRRRDGDRRVNEMKEVNSKRRGDRVRRRETVDSKGCTWAVGTLSNSELTLRAKLVEIRPMSTKSSATTTQSNTLESTTRGREERGVSRQRHTQSADTDLAHTKGS